MTRYQLFHGDCMDVMSELAAEGVDVIVTDPPYGIDIVALGRLGGDGIAPRRHYEKEDWDGEGLTAAQFDAMLRLADSLAIFGYEHLASVLGNAPGIIVWDKKCQNGWENDFSDCELVWLSRRAPARVFRYLHSGAIRRERRPREHPTQKPIVVMEYVLARISEPGDVVLDPFMGSGSTGVACMRMGRRFVGIEKERRYFEMAERRLAAAAAQPPLVAPDVVLVERQRGLGLEDADV